jgi:starch phosphorylase
MEALTRKNRKFKGYKVNTANTLRLWKSEACESFDFQCFNLVDYYGAVDNKVKSENLTLF